MPVWCSRWPTVTKLALFLIDFCTAWQRNRHAPQIKPDLPSASGPNTRANVDSSESDFLHELLLLVPQMQHFFLGIFQTAPAAVHRDWLIKTRPTLKGKNKEKRPTAAKDNCRSVDGPPRVWISTFAPFKASSDRDVFRLSASNGRDIVASAGQFVASLPGHVICIHVHVCYARWHDSMRSSKILISFLI